MMEMIASSIPTSALSTSRSRRSSRRGGGGGESDSIMNMNMRGSDSGEEKAIITRGLLVEPVVPGNRDQF